jgi:kinetochor protein Mis14/NSL1
MEWTDRSWKPSLQKHKRAKVPTSIVCIPLHLLIIICAELEPFDTKLAQRIQALSAQIEHQTLQLANLRRKAPQETAQKFTQSFEKQSEEYDARLKADEQAKLEAAKATSVDVGNFERVDEMQSTWQRGAEDLATLKSGLGGTVARMEKAQKAAEVVEER